MFSIERGRSGALKFCCFVLPGTHYHFTGRCIPRYGTHLEVPIQPYGRARKIARKQAFRLLLICTPPDWQMVFGPARLPVQCVRLDLTVD